MDWECDWGKKRKNIELWMEKYLKRLSLKDREGTGVRYDIKVDLWVIDCEYWKWMSQNLLQ
jgi:uncharacterized HAD superfamily protein